ncbi:MAG TPA: hypothetical protein DCW42_06935 [Bacteroidetes bacterium]|nr:hypothetical protein [Bacteroidota bacterium]
MSIPILNSYNPYIQNDRNNSSNPEEKKIAQDGIEARQDAKKDATISKLNQSNISKLSNSQDELFSQNERDYFVQLFPERKDLIERHIVFNRNGRVSQSNLSKGMILDGKV